MVTPDRRGVAVQRLQERFGVSERTPCRVVGQHRSTQRRPKAPPSANEVELREQLRDFARTHPRLGWRKAHTVACREGLVTNPKRTRRLWRDEGLQRPPQRKAKRRRLADGSAARLRAQRPNDVWALDFQFDETADLRRIKLLNVVDEYTREALAIDAAHSTRRSTASSPPSSASVASTRNDDTCAFVAASTAAAVWLDLRGSTPTIMTRSSPSMDRTAAGAPTSRPTPGSRLC